MHCNYVATCSRSVVRGWELELHLSDALQLRCYRKRRTANDLTDWLHLSDALQLRCYLARCSERVSYICCIYPMHCNYVATRSTQSKNQPIKLHLSDALQLRCYDNGIDRLCNWYCCIYPMHCNYVATRLKLNSYRIWGVASIRCTATTLLR